MGGLDFQASSRRNIRLKIILNNFLNTETDGTPKKNTSTDVFFFLIYATEGTKNP